MPKYDVFELVAVDFQALKDSNICRDRELLFRILQENADNIVVTNDFGHVVTIAIDRGDYVDFAEMLEMSGTTADKVLKKKNA